MKLLWPLVILVLACGKKPEQQPAPGSAATPGSATPAASVDLAATFTGCWAAQSKGDAAALEKCYAPEAVTESPGAGFPPATQRSAVLEAAKSLKGIFPDLLGEPQLVLIHDKKLVAVVRLTGTAAESKKPMGVLGGVVVDYNAAGQVTHESDFFDSQTIRGQLQPDVAHPVRAWDATSSLVKQTIASKGDAAETANVAAVKAMLDAFDKHDLAAFAATIADDGTWSDAAELKDWSKPELLADRKVGIQGFPDIAMKVQDIWGAGDFVVEVGEVQGTNTGAIPGISTPTKKTIAIPYLAIHQVAAGKVAHTWVFDQGSAFVTQLGLK